MRLAEEGEAMSSTNLLTEHLVAPLLPPPTHAPESWNETILTALTTAATSSSAS